MVPNEHEYKLMGMAPYAQTEIKGQAYRVFKELFKFDAKGITWTRKRPTPSAYYMFDYLKEKLEYERFDRICAGLQYWVEEMLATWVQNCVRETGLNKVALSGGVFMNVKANKVIAELPEVESLFVFPSCGDESNAVGAAWVEYVSKCREKGQKPDIEPIGPIYWGHKYSKKDVEKVLKREKEWLRYELVDDVEKKAAELIAKGEIVARFKGRMEFGARALGNRSILSDPSNTKQVKILNEMIKSRDFWMPFACSIMAEREQEYLKNEKSVGGPYMMMTYETTDQVEKIRAGTHPYDDTIRPQLVHKEWNPDYHHLIEEFEKRTGIGAVLNTSFNLHGFPIVGTPEAAIDVLKKSGLKWLAIEDFIVEKTSG
jgi:carbamoyltransferase